MGQTDAPTQAAGPAPIAATGPKQGIRGADHPLAQGFFASHHWPLITLLAYVLLSVIAFTPRLVDYALEGHWGQSATKAFEFAPAALNFHALFGMALIPLFLFQPLLGRRLLAGPGALGHMAGLHRWLGRFLAAAAIILSLLGLYITYTFAANTDSITSVIFMFLVASFVILFFLQAVWEARKGRIARHLEALVFAMIFLSVPATGRIIEAGMGVLGVENARSKDLLELGFGLQVQLVDITIVLVSAVPLVLWSLFAIPRKVFVLHRAKFGISAAFLVLPLVAVVGQMINRS